jgi:hypothetical protein
MGSIASDARSETSRDRALQSGFPIRRIYYDPWQLLGTAAALGRQGVDMTELPQTPSNVTEASHALYDVILGRRQLETRRVQKLSRVYRTGRFCRKIE